MKVTFDELLRRKEPVSMVVHSVELSIYQVIVTMEGGEHLLTENDGRPFRRHSLSAVQEALQFMPVHTLTLRQSSAYDEMIGQPPRESANTLEVPLSVHPHAPPTRH